MHKNILLYKAMLQHFSGDPRRCQHLIKVASLAKELALLEGADATLVDLVEAAGFVHDCGIVAGEAKYGKGHCTGKIQEQEGPAIAQRILSKLGYSAKDVERICYLVGHHHTYTDIDGLDYQMFPDNCAQPGSCPWQESRRPCRPPRRQSGSSSRGGRSCLRSSRHPCSACSW